MKIHEEAAEYFLSGFSCSQAVLYVFAEKYGLAKTTALKLADAFGSGMGGQGYTCGAVTAAYMVIGLKHGRTGVSELKKKEETRRLVKLFSEEFIKKHGGKIWIEDNSEKGSEFKFTLPLSPEKYN